MFIKNANLAKQVVIVAALAAAGAANATGPDFTTLTAGIDFSTVVTAVLAVAALKVVPLVAMWGGKKILSMVGR